MDRQSFGSLARVALLACAGLVAAAGDSLAQAVPATTPAPREGGWVKRHEKLLADAKAAREGQGADLIFLGDSITQGWNENAVWKKYYSSRKPLNLGIGGDRTQHVLWRLQNGEVEGLKPKAVMLMIGTNNSNSDSADDIAAGVKAIIDDIKSRLPEAKILLLAVFPRAEKPDAPARLKVQEINERISKFDDGKTVKYLDIGKVFLEPDGTISKEIMPDFLHLTLKGYDRWAEAVEPSIKELLGE